MREFIDIIKSDKKSKVLFVITIGVLFICTLSYSLSMFSNSKEGDLANIKVNGLSFNMTTNSGESDDRILKLKSNTLESFNVVLTNLNSMDVKYELIYEVCSDSSCSSTLNKLPDDVVFGISNDSVGKISDTITISDKKDIFILSNNTTDTDYYIKLNLNAGYSWNELALVNQIEIYHKDIDFIAYVDGVEQSKFPDGCNYDYTYKTYTKGVETTDSEVKLTCSNGIWDINVKNVPSKVKIYFITKNGTNAVELLTNLAATETGASYLRYDGTTDNNLRYYGGSTTDVDAVPNYISFNNELWRIIGVFDTYNVDTGKTEKSLKIIRSNALGNTSTKDNLNSYKYTGYSWDTSDESINHGMGINEWSQAALMDELNSDYLNPDLKRNTYWYSGQYNEKKALYDKSQSISYEYQQYIITARWYLGGIEYIYGLSALDAYVGERSNNVIKNPSDGVKRTTSWDGKVALMYPSDYGLASIDETCLSDLNYCDNDNNRDHNWLYISKGVGDDNYWEWLLTSYNVDDYPSLVYGLSYNGYIDDAGDEYYDASNDDGVRPCLFLSSEILLSGTGTSSDPYVIE